MYINQGGFKIHWWKHRVSRLEPSGEMFVMGFRDCLVVFSTSELIEAKGLIDKQISEGFIQWSLTCQVK